MKKGIYWNEDLQRVKDLLKKNKMALWQLRDLTNIHESKLSRYLSGIDEMPLRLFYDILNIIQEVENKKQEKLDKLIDSLLSKEEKPND